MADVKPTADERDEIFDPEFLDRLRTMFLMLRERRKLRRVGNQQTPVSGVTREFKDHRPYVPGDDYRNLDWKLVARLDKLFVRLYEELQEFHVHVLIDNSQSMAVPYPEKRVIALRACAALAYLGLVNQHTVSLHSLGKQVSRELPPKKGQGSISQWLEHLAKMPFGGGGDIGRALSSYRPVGAGGKSIVIVVSDLLGENPMNVSDAIRKTQAWQAEKYFVQILSPEEREPDLQGDWKLEDVETGVVRRIWLTNRERDAYKKLFEEYRTDLQQACIEAQIPLVSWGTEEDFETKLGELLWKGNELGG